jgi:hypothetical protein
VEPDPVPVDAIIAPRSHTELRFANYCEAEFSPIYNRQGLSVERRTGIEFRKAMLNTVFVRRMVTNGECKRQANLEAIA